MVLGGKGGRERSFSFLRVLFSEILSSFECKVDIIRVEDVWMI